MERRYRNAAIALGTMCGIASMIACTAVGMDAVMPLFGIAAIPGALAVIGWLSHAFDGASSGGGVIATIVALSIAFPPLVFLTGTNLGV